MAFYFSQNHKCNEKAHNTSYQLCSYKTVPFILLVKNQVPHWQNNCPHPPSSSQEECSPTQGLYRCLKNHFFFLPVPGLTFIYSLMIFVILVVIQMWEMAPDNVVLLVPPLSTKLSSRIQAEMPSNLPDSSCRQQKH